MSDAIWGTVLIALLSCAFCRPAEGQQVTETGTLTITTKSPYSGLLDTVTVKATGGMEYRVVNDVLTVLPVLDFETGAKIRYGFRTSPGGSPDTTTPPIPTPTAGKMVLSISASPGVCPAKPIGTVVMGANPNNVESILDQAVACKVPVLFLNLTGGGAEQYRSRLRDQRNGKTVLAWDRKKWDARMQGYNTPATKAAFTRAAKVMRIYGSVMDEPGNVSGCEPADTCLGSTEGNYKGPEGWITRMRVDSLCTVGKQTLPMVTFGVMQDPREFDENNVYTVCEWFGSNYRGSKGTPAQWRDAVLAEARRSGMKAILGMNILHGGPSTPGCPKYGDDPRGNLCPMTPAQIKTAGLLFAAVSCEAVQMWRFQEEIFEDTAYQVAFRELSDGVVRLPAVPCKRAA